MEIKAGYKKTDVGIIPQEWDVKIVGDLFDVSGGFSTSRSHLSNDGYCYLHYGDIHGSEKQYIDVENEYLSIPKLNVDLKRISPISLLKDGDIVFVDASEDDEGASKHVVIRNSKDIPFISGLHTIVLKSKDTSIANQYKEYCFLTHCIRRQFKFYAVGTKVTGISKTNIKNIKVVLPKEQAEQSAIAEALSDTDILIASLEKLIAKKKDIKQGAMQLLLTGKKRLPGFKEDWITTRLEELANISRGASPRPIDSPIWFDDNSPIGWVRILDVTKSKKFLKETTQKLSELGIKSSHFINKGNLIMSICATIGRPIITDVDTCIHDGFVVFSNLQIDRDFLYYFLSYIQKDWSKSGQVGSQMNLNTGIINSTQICFPKDPKEQFAIAQVLSDMDTEIDESECKLIKYKLIKQGMMQELLTGKKRLV